MGAPTAFDGVPQNAPGIVETSVSTITSLDFARDERGNEFQP